MDEAKLRGIFDKLFSEQARALMQPLHRVWLRNILFYLGEQWFEWASGQHTFRRISATRYAPTPVSNMIRDYVRSMKSLILNKDFTVTIAPNSEDQEDRDAAEMGELFLRWLETANDEEHLDEREKIAIWMILCGTAFDRTILSTEDDGWAFDKSGDPISTGSVRSACVNPFSVMVDLYGDTLQRKRFIGLKTLRPREWVEDTFKVKVPSESALEVEFEKRLATLVAQVSPWKGDGLDLSRWDSADDDLVVFKEVEIRPSREHPRGYYAAMVGDVIVCEHERLPIPTAKDGSWDWSLTDFHYHFVPGRFWSDPGVNDLISPQVAVNEIDRELAINRKGIGKPIVLAPTGLELKRLTRYGQGVVVLQYDPFTAGGQKPEIGRGIPLPPQVLDERAIHMAVAQDAAGDPKHVLRGSAPSAQASGVMVDILRDAAEQGHLPDVRRFFRSIKRVKRKQLLVAQEAYTEERLIKIPDTGSRHKIYRFRGADIRGNTDVRIEIASGVASTRVGQTNLLLKMVSEGVFNVNSPIDPELRSEVLRRVGLGGVRDRSSADMQRAQRENELCSNLRQEGGVKLVRVPVPDGSLMEIEVVEGLFAGLWLPGAEEPVVVEDDPMFEFDNHAVHYETHRRFIVSPDFAALPAVVRDAMIMHAKSHREAMRVESEKAAQAAAAQAAEIEAARGAARGAPAMPAEGLPVEA
ncbi:MAG: hypothetical protein WHT06_15910 [Desulfobacterales bacterium]